MPRPEFPTRHGFRSQRGRSARSVLRGDRHRRALRTVDRRLHVAACRRPLVPRRVQVAQDQREVALGQSGVPVDHRRHGQGLDPRRKPVARWTEFGIRGIVKVSHRGKIALPVGPARPRAGPVRRGTTRSRRIPPLIEHWVSFGALLTIRVWGLRYAIDGADRIADERVYRWQ